MPRVGTGVHEPLSVLKLDAVARVTLPIPVFVVNMARDTALPSHHPTRDDTQADRPDHGSRLGKRHPARCRSALSCLSGRYLRLACRGALECAAARPAIRRPSATTGATDRRRGQKAAVKHAPSRSDAFACCSASLFDRAPQTCGDSAFGHRHRLRRRCRAIGFTVDCVASVPSWTARRIKRRGWCGAWISASGSPTSVPSL
jgi:hypothetical protein